MCDKGKAVAGFVPKRFIISDEANDKGLIELRSVTIEYNGTAPDLGAYETDGGNIVKTKDKGIIKQAAAKVMWLVYALQSVFL